MQLTDDFILELFKTCTRSKDVLEVALNYIRYNYLPTEEHKEIWKYLRKHYEATEKAPTIGIISQRFENEPKVIELISEIKKADSPDKRDVLDQLELFVQDSIFLEAYDKFAELYKKGEKPELFDLIKKVGEEINDFKIDRDRVTTVFSGLLSRHHRRKMNAEDEELNKLTFKKVPLSIHQIDDATRGGVDKGDIFLALAQSGVGKTKFLRHLGYNIARRGMKVLHVQCEGTEQETLDGYDAALTGEKVYNVERGLLSKDKLAKVNKLIGSVNGKGGEIYVVAFEQFDTVTMADIRAEVQKIIEVHGELDAIVLDYLELVDPGDGKKYSTSNEGERKRREQVANKFKNICVEFNLAGFTATQASTVSPDLLNDPKFVQTRYNVSEFKGIIKPFSYFMTMNQTQDEYKKGIMRLYMDKIRKYKGGILIKIYQRYDVERFYDGKTTLEKMYEKEEA